MFPVLYNISYNAQCNLFSINSLYLLTPYPYIAPLSFPLPTGRYPIYVFFNIYLFGNSLSYISESSSLKHFVIEIQAYTKLERILTSIPPLVTHGPSDRPQEKHPEEVAKGKEAPPSLRTPTELL